MGAQPEAQALHRVTRRALVLAHPFPYAVYYGDRSPDPSREGRGRVRARSGARGRIARSAPRNDRRALRALQDRLRLRRQRNQNRVTPLPYRFENDDIDELLQIRPISQLPVNSEDL